MGNLKPFRKGTSGNPGGRPKIPREVREAARAHTDKAINVLCAIMEDDKAPASSRVSAAQAILDRGWGKPQQSLDVSTAAKSHEEWLAELS